MRGLLSLGAPGRLIRSTATITVYSSPTVLADVTTDGARNFSQPVTVPASLASGSHTILAQGAAPDGTLRSMAPVLLLCGMVLAAAGRPARVRLSPRD